MTFLEFAMSRDISIRGYSAIKNRHVTETTSYDYLKTFSGIGRRTIAELVQFQQDYIKTYDVAYQQVLEYIRNREVK